MPFLNISSVKYGTDTKSHLIFLNDSIDEPHWNHWHTLTRVEPWGFSFTASHLQESRCWHFLRMRTFKNNKINIKPILFFLTTNHRPGFNSQLTAMATMMTKMMSISSAMSSSSSPSPSPPQPSAQSLSTQSPPSPSLPLRTIPGSYGWPLLGPISDRLDYFWFQGPETFFRKRIDKYKSTVFRTNIPPSFPFFSGVNPNVVAVLDCKSFAHLFDMEIVEKRDVLVGDFKPSSNFTGNVRTCAYLDPSEPQHAKVWIPSLPKLLLFSFPFSLLAFIYLFMIKYLIY